MQILYFTHRIQTTRCMLLLHALHRGRKFGSLPSLIFYQTKMSQPHRNSYLAITACLVLALAAGCNFPAGSRPGATPPGLPAATPGANINPLAVAAQYLTSPRIVSYDPFDTMQNWVYKRETGTLVDGMFELQGTPRWQSSFWPRQQFKEGQGVAFRFKVQHSNARSEFVLVTGDWLTPTFRQFGFYNAVVPKGDLFQGTRDLGGYDLQGSLRILSDTWYEAILAVGRNGHMIAVVWDPANPSVQVFHDLAGGQNWAGLTWVFLPKANTGETVTVDDFFILIFGDIK